MSMAFRLVLVVVFGGAVILGIVIGRSQAPPTAAAAATPTATALPVPLPNTVNIVPSGGDNPPAAYDPPLLTVHAGDRITWINLSSGPQTVTADNGAFNSDVLAPGQSYSWAASRVGRFTYGSYLWPTVRGEIDVSP
jgi:plastocyanin